MGFDSMKDMLRGSMKSRVGIGKQIRSSQIVGATQEIIYDLLPRDGKQNAEVLSFRNGIIRVRARSGAVSYRLKGEIKEILAELRAMFPKTRILNISFFVSKDHNRKRSL